MLSFHSFASSTLLRLRIFKLEKLESRRAVIRIKPRVFTIIVIKKFAKNKILFLKISNLSVRYIGFMIPKSFN